MALVGYVSSDDEDEVTRENARDEVDRSNPSYNAVVPPGHAVSPSKAGSRTPTVSNEERLENQAPIGLSAGPSVGPSLPPPGAGILPDAQEDDALGGLSPYSADRTAIRNLTMPPLPNFDIPPSPPGSPPQASTKKFTHFLELKKNKGVHFNSKLESSVALRNPALLDKLKEFAGINDYDQYATALPEDLAVPTAFPPWAYGEQLNKTQQQLLKKKEEEKARTQRDKIDFVSAADGQSDPRRRERCDNRKRDGADGRRSRGRDRSKSPRKR